MSYQERAAKDAEKKLKAEAKDVEKKLKAEAKERREVEKREEELSFSMYTTWKILRTLIHFSGLLSVPIQ